MKYFNIQYWIHISNKEIYLYTAIVIADDKEKAKEEIIKWNETNYQAEIEIVYIIEVEGPVLIDIKV